MRTRALALGTAFTMASLALGACSSSSAPTAKSTTTTSTVAQKDFEVTTSKGQASLSLNGKLPPKWPSDFPLPAGAKPEGSGSLGGTETTALVGVFTTSKSGADVLDFYASDGKLTTTAPKSVGSGDSFVGSIKITAPYQAEVIARSKTGTNYLVVVLTV